MKLEFLFNKDAGTFDVLNDKHEPLGILTYFKQWRRWIWEQNQGFVMSAECLEQVVRKLKALDGIPRGPRAR